MMASMCTDQYCIRPSAMLGLGQWVEQCNLTRPGVRVLPNNVNFFFFFFPLPRTSLATQCLAILTRTFEPLISIYQLEKPSTLAFIGYDNKPAVLMLMMIIMTMTKLSLTYNTNTPVNQLMTTYHTLVPHVGQRSHL